MDGLSRRADLKSAHALGTWKAPKNGKTLRKAGDVLGEFANTKFRDQHLARFGRICTVPDEAAGLRGVRGTLAKFLQGMGKANASAFYN